MDENTRRLVDSYLPMSEQSLLLLLGLIEPRHGYGIMQLVQEQTKGRVNLSPSTVYTLLYKMENDGLIHTVSEIDRRKVYSITALGKTVLMQEASRIFGLASHLTNVLFDQDSSCDETEHAGV